MIPLPRFAPQGSSLWILEVQAFPGPARSSMRHRPARIPDINTT